MVKIELVFVVLTTLYLGSASIEIHRILKLRQPDSELREIIHKASSEATNGFNNIVDANFEALRQTRSFPNGEFDNAILEVDAEKFFLADLEIIGVPIPRFNLAVPDFSNGVMNSDVYWESVVVEGSFERFIRSETSNIGISSGKLRLVWDKIESMGKIGFLPSVTKDEFFSTNYDLMFHSKNIYLQFASDDGHQTKNIKISSDQLKSHLEEDLFWKLQNNLPASVDSFLLTTPSYLSKTLQLISTYMQDANEIINNFADEIIRMVKGGVEESGFWKFGLPEIREEFSKKFGFITFWGHLVLWNGEAQDVRSLKRSKSFSLVVDNDNYEIAGEVQLSQLAAKYHNYQANIWNIGPSGTVAVSAKNAFSFKVKAVRDDRTMMGFRMLSHSIKVHIDNIQVEATGLGSLFNWLLSLIATCVANSFKGDLSWLIEDNINQALENVISLIS